MGLASLVSVVEAVLVVEALLVFVALLSVVESLVVAALLQPPSKDAKPVANNAHDRPSTERHNERCDEEYEAADEAACEAAGEAAGEAAETARRGEKRNIGTGSLWGEMGSARNGRVEQKMKFDAQLRN